MKSGKKRAKALISVWYIFVVWAVISVILWHWITDLLTRPSSDEKISVFVCSENCGQAELVEKLQAARPEYIVQLEFKWVSSSDPMFAVYYDAFAVDGGDLIILPESKLNEYSYVDFLELDISAVESVYNRSFDYYRTEDGKAYGIEIDVLNSLGVQNQESSEQKYYLFFNKNSMHLGVLKDSARNAAVILAEVFL